MKSTQVLVQQLFNKIYTTNALRHVSDTLEVLTQNTKFKEHTNAIISDTSLTSSQKKTQIIYIIKSIDSAILYDFFYNILDKNTFWIFSSGKIDYFDRFVQEFQMATEQIGVVFLTTAISLNNEELKLIAEDLSRSFGYKVVINPTVNPTILGGAQVRVENLIFDYSLRSKFHQFQRQWISSLTKTNKLIGRHDL